MSTHTQGFVQEDNNLPYNWWWCDLNVKKRWCVDWCNAWWTELRLSMQSNQSNWQTDEWLHCLGAKSLCCHDIALHLLVWKTVQPLLTFFYNGFDNVLFIISWRTIKLVSILRQHILSSISDRKIYFILFIVVNVKFILWIGLQSKHEFATCFCYKCIYLLSKITSVPTIYSMLSYEQNDPNPCQSLVISWGMCILLIHSCFSP